MLDVTRHGDYPSLACPFPMGSFGRDESWRRTVVSLHSEWLRLGAVPAAHVRMPDGSPLPRAVRPRATHAALTGADCESALAAVAAASPQHCAVYLVCSRACRCGRLCHAECLAARLRQLLACEAV